MDARLDRCGRRLASFLSDDLSDTHLGLSTGARAHLDTFRSFLQSYHVAKLGYYPPASSTSITAAFPKGTLEQISSWTRPLRPRIPARGPPKVVFVYFKVCKHSTSVIGTRLFSTHSHYYPFSTRYLYQNQHLVGGSALCIRATKCSPIFVLSNPLHY